MKQQISQIREKKSCPVCSVDFKKFDSVLDVIKKNSKLRELD
jgi:hypothetical protein